MATPSRVGHLMASWTVAVAVAGCQVSASNGGEGRGGAPEQCRAGVRNEEWGIDCSAACQHVSDCRVISGDSDLRDLSCDDRLGSCLAGVELGGDDVAEST